MTFEEKVRSLTPKQVVMTMVKGLQREWVKVDMSTYGDFVCDVCFGCAATNTVCEIEGRPFEGSEIIWEGSRSDSIGCSYNFLDVFEQAINKFRHGDTYGYNRLAKNIGLALLPEPSKPLPILTTENYKNNLQAYIDYANTLEDGK